MNSSSELLHFLLLKYSDCHLQGNEILKCFGDNQRMMQFLGHVSQVPQDCKGKDQHFKLHLRMNRIAAGFFTTFSLSDSL